MRLLQLVTGPDELIDLHPHVTVVTGLDGAKRRLLVDAVTSLARGVAPGPQGLLEAHGILFDLSDEMLGLLDIDTGDLQPVVRSGDLPTRRPASPRARELHDKEAALAVLAERWEAASEADGRARDALDAAVAALEALRRSVVDSQAEAAQRLASLEAITAEVERAAVRRRQIDAALAEQQPRRAAATAHREAVDAATAEVRGAKQSAAARSADLAAALDRAASARDTWSGSEADAARLALQDLEAAVEAERLLDAQHREAQSSRPPVADLEARRAALEAQRDDLERALATFGSATCDEVERALAGAGAPHEPTLVPSPAALALAEQLDAIDASLGDLHDGDAPVIDLTARRARLDDARQALLEAEQAVRNPELDRDIVGQLELAHANLLNAIDRADGRFGGARAMRRVDELRAVEHGVLDELGFTSYSDFMMGSSLLHVDPGKERALDDARADLAAAEDDWRRLEEQTEAELDRAARLDRRRGLLDQAKELLGRPVGATGAAEALRSLRVEDAIAVDHLAPLRHALEAGGLALGDEDLELDELTALAEAWLDEAREAAVREDAVREELRSVEEELTDLTGMIDEERAMADAPPAEDPEVYREARLAAARDALAEAEAIVLAHEAAEEDVRSLTEDLALAVEEERVAGEAAAEAEEAMAAALAAEDPLVAEQRLLEEDLAVAARSEADAYEALRALSGTDDGHTSDATAEEVEAEQSVAGRSVEAAATAAALAALDAERQEAEQAAAELRASVGDAVDDPDLSIGEEIEWYLLARLAAQRSASLAGSLPLLLDDALQGLGERELEHILGRLERMAEAVQIIVVSENPTVATWAMMAGADRAAVVGPSAA